MTSTGRVATPEVHRDFAAAADANALRLLWLFALVVTAITIATPFAFRIGGDNYYMVCAVATGLVAMAATTIATRAPARHAMVAIIATAVLLRIILLFSDPMLSDDIHRYVWDGRVQAAGINPYRYIPADEVLAPLRDTEIFPKINRADYAVTIYPPVAQMFFFLATRLGESVTMMKLALLGSELVTATIILLLLQRLGRPLTHLVAYAWHPLPLWEIANSGHVDALMVALMMLGIWLAVTGRLLGGGAVIALAALVKPFAALALPAIWRAWDWKLPLVVLAVAVLCYVPYLSVGKGVLGFLAEGYLREERFVSGDSFWALFLWRQVFGTLALDTIVYLIGSIMLIGAIAMVAATRNERTAETVLVDINRLLLTFLFLLSPNYPWYFLAATPFVALVGGAPVWALTIGAVLLQEEVSWGGHVPIMIRKSIHFGVFLLACGYAVWRSRQGHAIKERAGGEHVDVR